jgi:hypothetical protein
MARAMRIIAPPQACILLHAPGKAGSRFSEDIPPSQRVEVRRKSCSPDGAPDNFDHLFDHLSMGFHGVSERSSELHQEQNRLSRGFMEVLEDLMAPTYLDYESEGRRFESCRARPSNSRICRSFSSSSAFSATTLSESDRNVTGVGPPVGPFEAPKSGSPRVSAACSKLDSLLKYAFAPTKEGHHPVK